MIGVIFATRREALPFLRALNCSCVRTRPLMLYKPKKTGILSCIVVISGIGKVAAAVATSELIINYKVDFIINIGICGALKDSMSSKLGKIYKIHSAFEGDRSLNFTKVYEIFKCVSFFNSLEEVILVTVDRSIFNNTHKKNMSLTADLVDMEGAAILRVASMYNVGCDIIKGVTDLADRDGAVSMENNIEAVSSSLSKVLVEAIKK